MEECNSLDSDDAQCLFLASPEAVEAVARSLYGEDEFDALGTEHQVKDAYRKRARALLKLAADATPNSASGPQTG